MTDFRDSRVFPDNVVWIQTGFLGDVVLTTAAIELLQKFSLNTAQFVVTTRAGREALAGLVAEERIVLFEKRKRGYVWKAMRDVRNQLQGFGLNRRNCHILQIHRSLRSSLLARLVGFPTTTYHEANVSWLATENYPRVAVFHEAHRIALLLQSFGLKREQILQAMPSLPLSEKLPGCWAELGLRDQERVLAIAPGSQWGTKIWPVDYFAQLVERIVAETDMSIVLIGGQEENPLGETIVRKVNSSRVHNLIGRTSLRELKQVFSRFSAVVSNDSSPVHFASAYGVPTVALFGATVSGMGFGPLARGSKALEISLSCRPCSDHGPQRCPLAHFKCMRELSVDKVWAALEPLVSSAS